MGGASPSLASASPSPAAAEDAASPSPSAAAEDDDAPAAACFSLVAHSLSTYSSQDSPAIEGTDLAGLTQDLNTYREMSKAYWPVMERELQDKFNSQLLMIYAWPSQQLWCNLGDKSKTTVSLAETVGAEVIVAFSTSGNTAVRIARERPRIPFVVLSPFVEVRRRLAILWGTQTAGSTITEDFEAAIAEGCLLYTSPSPRDAS